MWTTSGTIFERTEITPNPPNERIGKIWSSFPEYICKLSLQSAAISATWDKLPLASFMATMFSILESSKQVEGNMFKPVLLGTLYIIIGKEVEFAIAVKCAIKPAWVVLL